MPYVKEPFRWGAFIVNAGAIVLAAYLWDVHRVNVYFWLGWLYGLKPDWMGAMLGGFAGVAGAFAVTIAVINLEKIKAYRIHFRNRTKLGWIRERVILGAMYYFAIGATCSFLWMLMLFVK